MFGKKAFFYIGSSTAIALAAQALGASMGVVLLVSSVGPSAILLTLTVIHYRRTGLRPRYIAPALPFSIKNPLGIQTPDFPI
jgi:hypothetical protein